jgi:hypothetical protein
MIPGREGVRARKHPAGTVRVIITVQIPKGNMEIAENKSQQTWRVLDEGADCAGFMETFKSTSGRVMDDNWKSKFFNYA